MAARYIVICLVAALAVVTIIPVVYEHVTGVHITRASSKNGRVKAVSDRRPVARAYIVGTKPEFAEPQVEVPIYSVSDIYASVGVGQKEFLQWQEKYGFGTLGITDEGVLFVPDYPVLSKIAWMGIDPIDLSSAETSMLIEECTKARSRSVDAVASTELEALIALARTAIAVGGTVRFGLP
jgi:hypothetical protein